MTFEARETSSWDGSPVELLIFARGSQRWNFTSGDEEVVKWGLTFTPAPITRGKLFQGPQLLKSELKITVARDNPIATQFIAWAPQGIISVSLYQFHRDESEYQVGWVGRVLGVSFSNSEAELLCEPITTSLRRFGLTRGTSLACPYQVYATECSVDRGAFEAAGNITAIDGTVVTVTEAGLEVDGYFAGGYATHVNSEGLIEYRTIMTHVGEDLGLSYQIPNMAVDDYMQFYPGCARTWDVCVAKFSNGDNYGGQPFLTIDVNPFTDKVF